MDLAYTNCRMVGMSADEYEPEIIQTGTPVGVVYRHEDECIALSYNEDVGILESHTLEDFLTFTREGV